jgi:hypothetical protein
VYLPFQLPIFSEIHATKLDSVYGTTYRKLWLPLDFCNKSILYENISVGSNSSSFSDITAIFAKIFLCRLRLTAQPIRINASGPCVDAEVFIQKLQNQICKPKPTSAGRKLAAER